MIEIKKCSKSFGSVKAVDKVSLEIGEREVFGLVGSNGAGKSTLLRMAAGILKPDEGEIQIDGENIYDNEKAKACIFYIPDDSYFPADYTPRDIADFYRCYYPKFDVQRFSKFLRQFHMDDKKRISTFSKGMRKQLLVLLGVSAGTKYLLCDETFDGLDPVMRRQIWSIIMSEVAENQMTVLVSSHNLRELEDVCDHVGIMHQGTIMIERSLSDLQGSVSKIQVACQNGVPKLPEEFEVLHMSNTGRVYTLIVKGDPEDAKKALASADPAIVDVLPLTLEEIFIYEMGGADYEVKDILF